MLCREETRKAVAKTADGAWVTHTYAQKNTHKGEEGEKRQSGGREERD